MSKIGPIWGRCYEFLDIFAEKSGKKLAFLAQNKAKLFKNLIITLVFEKNAVFSPKIVIITSVPGHPACSLKFKLEGTGQKRF
jgi:hypothetical protein